VIGTGAASSDKREWRLFDCLGAAISSTKVFHPPQLGQRPIHRAETYPQSWQTYFDWLFTIQFYQNVRGIATPRGISEEASVACHSERTCRTTRDAMQPPLSLKRSK